MERAGPPHKQRMGAGTLRPVDISAVARNFTPHADIMHRHLVAAAPLRQHAVKADLAQHVQRRRHMAVRQAAQQRQSRRLITAQYLVAQQPPQRFDLPTSPKALKTGTFAHTLRLPCAGLSKGSGRGV